MAKFWTTTLHFTARETWGQFAVELAVRQAEIRPQLKFPVIWVI
jgi:hypothetical protein